MGGETPRPAAAKPQQNRAAAPAPKPLPLPALETTLAEQNKQLAAVAGLLILPKAPEGAEGPKFLDQFSLAITELKKSTSQIARLVGQDTVSLRTKTMFNLMNEDLKQIEQATTGQMSPQLYRALQDKLDSYLEKYTSVAAGLTGGKETAGRTGAETVAKQLKESLAELRKAAPAAPAAAEAKPPAPAPAPAPAPERAKPAAPKVTPEQQLRTDIKNNISDHIRGLETFSQNFPTAKDVDGGKADELRLAAKKQGMLEGLTKAASHLETLASLTEGKPELQDFANKMEYLRQGMAALQKAVNDTGIKSFRQEVADLVRAYTDVLAESLVPLGSAKVGGKEVFEGADMTWMAQHIEGIQTNKALPPPPRSTKEKVIDFGKRGGGLRKWGSRVSPF